MLNFNICRYNQLVSIMKFTAIFLFIFFIALVENTHAQYISGVYQGEQTSGNYGAKAVKTVPNDGYIMVGSNTMRIPENKDEVYVLRISDSLEPKWSKTVKIEGKVWGNSVELTPDGGFIIAGTSEAKFTEKKSIYLLKLSSAGEIEWSKNLSEIEGNQEGNAIKATEDDGFVIVGSTQIVGEGKNVYIVKLDSEGEVEWSNSIGGLGNDIAHAVDTTLDGQGGYIIAGETDSFDVNQGSADSYIVKLDSLGNLEWSTLITPFQWSKAYGVVAIPGDGYAVAGKLLPNGYIVKLDAYGNLEWSNKYVNQTHYSGFHDIDLMGNGNLVASGVASGGVSFLMVESNVNGDFVQGNQYFGQEKFAAFASAPTDDGGLITVGTKNARYNEWGDRVFYVKQTPSLLTCESLIPVYSYDDIPGVARRSGGVVTKGGASLTDVMSIEGEGFDIFRRCNSLGKLDHSKLEFSIYPNPAYGFFFINSEALIYRIEITALDGKKIYSSEVRNHSISVSTRDFSAGMYLVTIHSEAGSSTKKVMVSK